MKSEISPSKNPLPPSKKTWQFKSKLLFENLMHISPKDIEDALQITDPSKKLPPYLEILDLKITIQTEEQTLASILKKGLHGQEAWLITQQLCFLYLICANIFLTRNIFSKFSLFYSKTLHALEPPFLDSPWPSYRNWKVLFLLAKCHFALFHCKNQRISETLLIFPEITNLSRGLLGLDKILYHVWTSQGLLLYRLGDWKSAEEKIGEGTNFLAKYLKLRKMEMVGKWREEVGWEEEVKGVEFCRIIEVYLLYLRGKVSLGLRRIETAAYLMKECGEKMKAIAQEKFKVGEKDAFVEYIKGKLEKMQIQIGNNEKNRVINEIVREINNKEQIINMEGVNKREEKIGEKKEEILYRIRSNKNIEKRSELIKNLPQNEEDLNGYRKLKKGLIKDSYKLIGKRPVPVFKPSSSKFTLLQSGIETKVYEMLGRPQTTRKTQTNNNSQMITRNSFSTKSISENSIGRATTASSDFWSKIAKIKQDFEERSKEEASKRVADLISKLPKENSPSIQKRRKSKRLTGIDIPFKSIRIDLLEELNKSSREEKDGGADKIIKLFFDEQEANSKIKREESLQTISSEEDSKNEREEEEEDKVPVELKTSKKMLARKNVSFFGGAKKGFVPDEKSIRIIQRFFRTRAAKNRGYMAVEAESAAALSMISAKGRKFRLSFQRLERKLSWDEGRKGVDRRMRRRRSEGGGREEGGEWRVVDRVGERGGGDVGGEAAKAGTGGEERGEGGGEGGGVVGGGRGRGGGGGGGGGRGGGEGRRNEEDIIVDEANWEKYFNRKIKKQFLEIRRKSIKTEKMPIKEDRREEDEEQEQRGKSMTVGAMGLISNYNMKLKRRRDEKKEEKADFCYVNFCFNHFFCRRNYRFKVRFGRFTQVGNTTYISLNLICSVFNVLITIPSSSYIPFEPSSCLTPWPVIYLSLLQTSSSLPPPSSSSTHPYPSSHPPSSFSSPPPSSLHPDSSSFPPPPSSLISSLISNELPSRVKTSPNFLMNHLLSLSQFHFIEGGQNHSIKLLDLKAIFGVVELLKKFITQKVRGRRKMIGGGGAIGERKEEELEKEGRTVEEVRRLNKEVRKRERVLREGEEGWKREEGEWRKGSIWKNGGEREGERRKRRNREEEDKERGMREGRSENKAKWKVVSQHIHNYKMDGPGILKRLKYRKMTLFQLAEKALPLLIQKRILRRPTLFVFLKKDSITSIYWLVSISIVTSSISSFSPSSSSSLHPPSSSFRTPSPSLLPSSPSPHDLLFLLKIFQPAKQKTHLNQETLNWKTFSSFIPITAHILKDILLLSLIPPPSSLRPLLLLPTLLTIQNGSLIFKPPNQKGLEEALLFQQPKTLNKPLVFTRKQEDKKKGKILEQIFEGRFNEIYAKDFVNKREEVGGEEEEEEDWRREEGGMREEEGGRRQEEEEDFLIRKESMLSLRKEEDLEEREIVTMTQTLKLRQKVFYLRLKKGESQPIYLKFTFEEDFKSRQRLFMMAYQPLRRLVSYCSIEDSTSLLLLHSSLLLSSSLLRCRELGLLLRPVSKPSGFGYMVGGDVIASDLRKRSLLMASDSSVKAHLLKNSQDLLKFYERQPLHFLAFLPLLNKSRITVDLYVREDGMREWQVLIGVRVAVLKARQKMVKIILNKEDLDKNFGELEVGGGGLREGRGGGGQNVLGAFVRKMTNIIEKIRFLRQNLYSQPIYVPESKKNEEGKDLRRCGSVAKSTKNQVQELQRLRWMKNVFGKQDFGKSQKNVSKAFLEEYIQESRLICQFIKKLGREFSLITIKRHLILDYWILEIYIPRTARSTISFITSNDLLFLEVKDLQSFCPLNTIISHVTYKNYRAFQKKFRKNIDDSPLNISPVADDLRILLEGGGEEGRRGRAKMKEERREDGERKTDDGGSSWKEEGFRKEEEAKEEGGERKKEEEGEYKRRKREVEGEGEGGSIRKIKLKREVDHFESRKMLKIIKIKMITDVTEKVNEAFIRHKLQPKVQNLLCFIEIDFWEKLITTLELKSKDQSYFLTLQRFRVELKQILFSNYVRIDKNNDAYVEIFFLSGKEHSSFLTSFEPISYAATSNQNILIRYISLNKLSIQLERINLREIINLFIADGFSKFQTNYMNSKFYLSDLKNLCNFIIYKIKSSNFANLIHDSAIKKKHAAKNVHYFNKLQLDNANAPAVIRIFARSPNFLLVKFLFQLQNNVVGLKIYQPESCLVIGREYRFEKLAENVPFFWRLVEKREWGIIAERVVRLVKRGLFVDVNFEMILLRKENYEDY